MTLLKDLLKLKENTHLDDRSYDSHFDHDYKKHHDEIDEDKDLDELVDDFLDNEGHHSLEGRKGLIALCSLVSALGYKDRQHSMQLSPSASVGDLVNFLEDNSGAIENIIMWIKDQHNSEWESNLRYED